jgi:hypothetical protein
MKSLPYQLRLILASVAFGGINFVFHVWDKESPGRAAGEAMITTLVFGILIHCAGTLKKTK